MTKFGVENQTFANKIAELCFQKYAELPKTGKPNSREWTLLSCIVKVEDWHPISQCSIENLSMEIVSLGTGSKCIGRSSLSSYGDVVNDSHAEVIARRGFLRYLYEQMQLYLITKSSNVFCTLDNKCAVRGNITFHLFSSHTPCGDGSIFPKEVVFSENHGIGLDESTDVCQNELCCLPNVRLGKRKEHNTCENMLSKRQHVDHEQVEVSCELNRSLSKPVLDNVKLNYNSVSVTSEDFPIHSIQGVEIKDIYRTGAKCLTSETQQDALLPGKEYHVVGVLRTKPGRGDPTLSLSCSDKLARWNIVGLQGALLSLFLGTPVYLSTMVIGGGCPISYVALYRALVGRFSDKISGVLPSPFSVNRPLLLQATIPFSDSRSDTRKYPCPSSLIWCSVENRSIEIAVNGKKQGITKKTSHTPSARLLISKKELLKQFINLVFITKQNELPMPFPLPNNFQNFSYFQWKSLAKGYYFAWHKAKNIAFPAWKTKCENLLLFTVDEKESNSFPFLSCKIN